MENTRVKKIFGTDGVRGHANKYPMTVEVALALGRAAGRFFKRDGQKRHRVVIGKDTRLSCYMYENALISGLCSMGVDTLMVGPFPTPGVSFITRAYRADAGVVISASHNPFYDNGIKFFSSEGFKLADDWEEEIEEIINFGSYKDALPSDRGIGKNTKVHDADGRYIEFAKGTFPRRQNLEGLKIVLDCANGGGYRVAPPIFKELDAEVIEYGVEPNGININENCGSLHPHFLQKKVIEHGADIGIALDGDADRVLLVDEKGEVVDGDMILALCARDMNNQGLLQNNAVVSTVMCNLGLVKAMEAEGIKVIQSKVGDRYVIQEMLKSGAKLGGEQSGHLIFADYNTTGDGIVSALQVLRIMMHTGKSLSKLASIMERYPQVCRNIKVEKKPPLESLPAVKEAIERVQKHLGKNGRVLVRYSGTENICRVMVEGRDAEDVERRAGVIAAIVQEEIGTE